MIHNNCRAIQLSVKDSIRFQIISKYLNFGYHPAETAPPLNVSISTITRINQKAKKETGLRH